MSRVGPVVPGPDDELSLPGFGTDDESGAGGWRAGALSVWRRLGPFGKLGPLGQLGPLGPLSPLGILTGARRGEGFDVLVVYVPHESTEAVLTALFAAGAGAIGDYRECAWVTAGTGQFRALRGATPTVGQIGELVTVAEDRCELVIPAGRRDEVVAALRAAHPYEEPAFHILGTAH